MRRLLFAASIALAGCAEEPAPDVQGLLIEARDVALPGGQLRGLSLMGAAVLTARHPKFGGLSGIAIRNGRMTFVSDQGWRLSAPIRDTDRGVRPGPADFSRLWDADGPIVDKGGGDAEGLALIGDRIGIAFERDHRIVIYGGSSPVSEIRYSAFERLSKNGGLEALATLPDGQMLAIAEEPVAGAFPAFILASDGTVTPGRIPQSGPHLVTGADLGPGRQAIRLMRDFFPFLGAAMRIDRYALGKDGFPDPQTREVLASLRWEHRYRQYGGDCSLAGREWPDSDHGCRG